jgi:hypothetical protein
MVNSHQPLSCHGDDMLAAADQTVLAQVEKR